MDIVCSAFSAWVSAVVSWASREMIAGSVVVADGGVVGDKEGGVLLLLRRKADAKSLGNGCMEDLWGWIERRSANWWGWRCWDLWMEKLDL